MHKNQDRTAYFKKSDTLEGVLKSINEGTRDVFADEMAEPTQPIILIMGCPRAGSTLFLQWMASLGIFSYPSNLIARFYKNPYLGIRIQQALIEFDPLNQLGFNANISGTYTSQLGKTMGAMSPSEYWYFWRQYFDFDDINMLRKENIENINSDDFLNKIAAFERLTNKIPVMKGMIMNWHIPDLYKIYNKFLFINIEREPLYNAQSLIISREKYFNDRNKWYSFKPPEYVHLKNGNYLEQVAGQVMYMRQAVRKGLAQIPNNNSITIQYETFCQNPQKVFKLIKELLNELGADLTRTVLHNEQFKPFNVTNKVILNQQEIVELKSFISKYNG